MYCRRVTEAMQDRDVRLADLQSKIEQLSRAKERAVQDNGSEVASLEVKLVGFIKDNSELLRANKWVSFGGLRFAAGAGVGGCFFFFMFDCLGGPITIWEAGSSG